EGLQYPYRWPYLVVWVAWLVLAGLTFRGLRTPAAVERPPLAWHSTRTWAVFFLLCGNVVALNMFAGLPVFVFLPVLATLSSFAFSVLVGLVSRKFGLAGLAMFVTGIFIARFPAYGFLIYGGSWLLILQALGLILLRRKRSFLTQARVRAAAN